MKRYKRSYSFSWRIGG